jgi:hypothetical protein
MFFANGKLKPLYTENFIADKEGKARQTVLI